MRQYLLGSLPGDEAERLDELSVTDEAFAEALSVAERDLIDAYVQGEPGVGRSIQILHIWHAPGARYSLKPSVFARSRCDW
jgi:hypothetical protein